MGGALAVSVLQAVRPLLGVFDVVASVAGLLAPGLAVGWMQARTFPRALDIHRRWWVATTLGSAAAPFLITLLASVLALGNTGSVLNVVPWTQLLALGVLGGATVGVVVGVFQALVLRGYTQRRYRWVVASGLSGVLAAILAVWGMDSVPPLLLMLCLVTVYAVVTAFVFPSLLPVRSA